MVARSRKTLKNRFFAFFLKKTTPYGKIFKFLIQKNSSRHRSKCSCSNFVTFGRREIGKVVRYLADKKNKNSPGSSAPATERIAPKIYQGQPPRMDSECSRFHPNRFTFGGVIPELMNTIKTGCRVNPVFG